MSKVFSAENRTTTLSNHSFGSEESKESGVLEINDAFMTKLLEKHGEAISILEDDASRRDWLKNHAEKASGGTVSPESVVEADAKIMDIAENALLEMEGGKHNEGEVELTISGENRAKLKSYLYTHNLLRYGGVGVESFFDIDEE